MVDEKQLSFTPAVEISFIRPRHQKYIAVAIEGQASSPSLSQAQKMRELDIPLFSLESRTPVKQFDLLGITLQYEMSYSNILCALDLAGIPLRRENRTDDDPFVICGGPCAFNPEPLAPFVDFFVLGDGEKSTHDTIDVYKEWKKSGLPREEYLKMAAKIPPGW